MIPVFLPRVFQVEIQISANERVLSVSIAQMPSVVTGTDSERTITMRNATAQVKNHRHRSFAGVLATVLGFSLLAAFVGVQFSDLSRIVFGIAGGVVGLLLAIRSH